MNYKNFDDTLCSERQCKMNEMLFSRNVPDAPLQPYLSSRPVLTKYSIMPVVDPRKEIKTPLSQRPIFDISSTFNPGSDMGPWSGYASNVNSESELRNQFNALQRCDQSVYVPSSNSSLYQSSFQPKYSSSSQPFPHLFQQEEFSAFNPNPNPDKIGSGLFYNATRQQLKDLTQETKCK
jgi:hypothetical protein